MPILWRFNPRNWRRVNWLGETRRAEILRRVAALEDNIQADSLRLNDAFNRIVVIEAEIGTMKMDISDLQEYVSAHEAKSHD